MATGFKSGKIRMDEGRTNDDTEVICQQTPTEQSVSEHKDVNKVPEITLKIINKCSKLNHVLKNIL